MTMPRYQNHPFGSTEKLQVTCHSLQLAKIQGMESISKPRLRFEIYASQEIMSTENFRKHSSFVVSN
jgi:hypothetical protein